MQVSKLKPATPEMGYRFRRTLVLTEAIEKRGEVIEPLLVIPLPNGEYQIIDGTERYYVALDLGIQDVPIRIANLGENPNGLIL